MKAKRTILIVTGQSGSGKSTAMRTLEDHGFFCVDNVPTRLAMQLVETVFAAPELVKLALSIDIRERLFLREAPAFLTQLRAGVHALHVIFLQASETALVRRYSETRRLHPLDEGRGLRAALKKERGLLEPLRELADQTLDTSHMSPHVLRRTVTEQLAQVGPASPLRVGLQSFGFKHGVPSEADIVLDVRFLPNPYFIDGMREQTGKDPAVRDYVLRQANAQEFLRRTLDMLKFLLPLYRQEGKFYLTLAIGCTGGRHRSVALVQQIDAELRKLGTHCSTIHRDVTLRGEQKRQDA